jgi:hypothetical protein
LVDLLSRNSLPAFDAGTLPVAIGTSLNLRDYVPLQVLQMASSLNSETRVPVQDVIVDRR